MRRRIIDGTAYDRDTAERVWGDPTRDEQVIVLYRTRHGAFFFYERYLVPCRDEDGNPQEKLEEGIFPCTDERAQQWLEEHENELVEKYFGEMPEGGSAERRLTLRMLNTLAKKLEEIAKTNAVSLNHYINQCLERCAAEKLDGRVNVLPPPGVPEKIMRRSYQRGGEPGAGTLLSSGVRQATVPFPSPTFNTLKRLAAESGLSLSEMVRQLVDVGLSARGEREDGAGVA